MKTFAELDLIAPVQRALADEQYKTPTPIQAQTIPAAVEGRDILGCAQTGTGKTASFALPILNQLAKLNRKATPKRPSVLVLAPTRELAIQIGDSFSTYGRHLRLRVALVYGGVSQVNQVRNLNHGADIVVATPGRLLDLMNQGHIELNQLKVFVLDEADQMLNMGFLPDLKRIISKLPSKRQSMFFSATLPPKIRELSKTLLRNPLQVNVTPKTTSVKKIEQQMYFVDRGGKLTLLKRILGAKNVRRTLIFTRTKRGANQLAEKLNKSGIGIAATAIHGNKSQNARIRALEAFRRDDVQVLVATDVAARGIDIDGITHVINYDIPVDPESYVHRIGRTGRAGAAGVALSFCTPDERSDLREIEKLIGQQVPLAADQPQSGESSRTGRSSRSNDQNRPSQPRRQRGSTTIPTESRGKRPSRRRKGSSTSRAQSADQDRSDQSRQRKRPSSQPMESNEGRPKPQKQQRRNDDSPSAAPKGAYSQHVESPSSSNNSDANDKPRRRRRQRGGEQRKQRVKQTS